MKMLLNLMQNTMMMRMLMIRMMKYDDYNGNGDGNENYDMNLCQK
jgi:hypothetical protein